LTGARTSGGACGLIRSNAKNLTNGEFVGGSDIMSELFQSGELQKMLESVAQPG